MNKKEPFLVKVMRRMFCKKSQNKDPSQVSKKRNNKKDKKCPQPGPSTDHSRNTLPEDKREPQPGPSTDNPRKTIPEDKSHSNSYIETNQDFPVPPKVIPLPGPEGCAVPLYNSPRPDSSDKETALVPFKPSLQVPGAETLRGNHINDQARYLSLLATPRALFGQGFRSSSYEANSRANLESSTCQCSQCLAKITKEDEQKNRKILEPFRSVENEENSKIKKTSRKHNFSSFRNDETIQQDPHQIASNNGQELFKDPLEVRDSTTNSFKRGHVCNDELPKSQNEEKNSSPKNATEICHKALSKIRAISKEVEDFREKVRNFSGSNNNNQHLFLEEMLTRCMLNLDNVDTEGINEIRQVRKAAILEVKKAISELESKVRNNQQDISRQSYSDQNNKKEDAEIIGYQEETNLKNIEQDQSENSREIANCESLEELAKDDELKNNEKGDSEDEKMEQDQPEYSSEIRNCEKESLEERAIDDKSQKEAATQSFGNSDECASQESGCEMEYEIVDNTVEEHRCNEMILNDIGSSPSEILKENWNQGASVGQENLDSYKIENGKQGSVFKDLSSNKEENAFFQECPSQVTFPTSIPEENVGLGERDFYSVRQASTSAVQENLASSRKETEEQHSFFNTTPIREGEDAFVQGYSRQGTSKSTIEEVNDDINIELANRLASTHLSI